MAEFRLYTKPGCPYCQDAKQLLDELGLPYEDTNVEETPELQARLSSENNGYKTVPMIFRGDEFLGGFSELKALHESGQLVSASNE